MNSPNNVRTAVIILWSSLLVGMAEELYIYVKAYGPQFFPGEIIITAIPFVFTSLLIILIYKGRKWSRILYLILFLFTQIAPYVLDLKHTIYPMHYHISSLTQILLNTIAYVFLFTKESKIWFNRIKKRNALAV